LSPPAYPPDEDASMGTVVKFPQSACIARDGRTMVRQHWSATVIILPVVRIERYDNIPPNHFSVRSNAVLGRKRRRRASPR
jgi:hypothetical protein